MKIRTPWLKIFATAGCLAWSVSALAQTSASSGAAASSALGAETTPAARLRDYEATYQAGLRKIQTPLLTEYALKLQQLLVTAPTEEQPAITAEIERVKRIITSGAVVDLRSASQPQAASPMPMPQLDAPPGIGNGKGPPILRPLLGAVLVLKPDTAKGPAVLGDALTLGKAQWTVGHLDAGAYDISVVLSFPSFTGKASLVASLAGEEVREDLSETRSSAAPDQFRLLRLGKMTFEAELKNQELTLALDSTTLSGVQVRQVIISRPRPPAK